MVAENLKPSKHGRDIEKIDKFLFISDILNYADKKGFGEPMTNMTKK